MWDSFHSISFLTIQFSCIIRSMQILAIIRRYKYSTQSDMISGVTLFVSKQKQRRFSPRESSSISFTVHSFPRAVRHNARQTGQNVTRTTRKVNIATQHHHICFLLSQWIVTQIALNQVNSYTCNQNPGITVESRWNPCHVCTSLFRKSERVTVHITRFTHAISGIYLITRLPGINMSLKCSLLFNDSMYTFMHLADALIQSDLRSI